MSSPLFPGQIPLPPAQTQLHQDPGVAAYAPQAAPAQAYDAATLAYYQAYYAQYNQYMAAMSAAGAAAAASPATGWPVTGSYPSPHVTGWPVTGVVPAAAASAVTESSASGAAADEEDEDQTVDNNNHKKNILSVYGNEKTMNLNSLILTNIQQSNYFRNTLYSIKTFNELMDEIWENVKHCEPWERTNRKVSFILLFFVLLTLIYHINSLSNQMGTPSGMCGSVRGVGTGGIISTAFCCLYKLLTLRPTRKQVNTMIKYKDAPFIRAIGFLFIRFTQPPDQLWTWFSKFLSDEEEFCPASVAGSSSSERRITIGNMCRQMLTKQDWFSALFPRIPIPIQKQIDAHLLEYDNEYGNQQQHASTRNQNDDYDRDYEKQESGDRRSDDRRRDRDGDRKRRDRSRSNERKRGRSRSPHRPHHKHSSSSSRR